MLYALSLPNFGDFHDARLVAELARQAEGTGWDGFFVWDHLLGWNGNHVADPWIVLATVAVSSTRLVLGPIVTPLPRRRPWQVVRQVVTLDRLSEGRAVLGVGLGFPPHEEFGVFGEPEDARTRAELLDEGLEIVAGLQSGEPFRFQGRHFQLDEMVFLPRPVQRPRVPIWVAGSWPNRAPMRRAARWDGVVPIRDHGQTPLSVEDLRALLDYVREHRPASGTGVDGGRAGGRGTGSSGTGSSGVDGPADRRFDVVFSGTLPRDAGQARERAGELAAAGATWWQVFPEQGRPLDDLRELIRTGPPR